MDCYLTCLPDDYLRQATTDLDIEEMKRMSPVDMSWPKAATLGSGHPLGSQEKEQKKERSTSDSKQPQVVLKPLPSLRVGHYTGG